MTSFESSLALATNSGLPTWREIHSAAGKVQIDRYEGHPVQLLGLNSTLVCHLVHTLRVRVFLHELAVCHQKHNAARTWSTPCDAQSSGAAVLGGDTGIWSVSWARIVSAGGRSGMLAGMAPGKSDLASIVGLNAVELEKIKDISAHDEGRIAWSSSSRNELGGEFIISGGSDGTLFASCPGLLDHCS